MQIEFAHGMKPQLIKRISVFVGICYLIGLLQHQVVDMLHTISHGLEMPSSILSHDNETNTMFNTHDNHDHDDRANEHGHEFINFVDLVLDSSNQNHDSEDVPLPTLKVNKHLVVFDYELPLRLKKETANKYYWPNTILQNGYSKKLDDPPIPFVG